MNQHTFDLLKLTSWNLVDGCSPLQHAII